MRARALAPEEPSNPLMDRPEATGATICIETSCGATPFRDLNRIPFRPTPAPQAISAVEQDLTYRDPAGNVTAKRRPVDAVRTFARLMQISPVPFTFLDAANNPSPIPRYRAVRDGPTDKIWEDADAFDMQIGRVGHSTFGAFNSSKDAGVSFSNRTSVGTSDPIGDGTPDRPLTVIAHEVLHTFGIGHADKTTALGGCGGGGGGFPEPTGRLGSVGIDTRFLSGGGVGSPPYRMIPDTATTPGYDLMSYCATLGGGDANSWISAINWNAMLGAGAPPARRNLSAAADPVAATAAANPVAETTLHVRARLQGAGVRIESVGRSTGPSPEAAASPYRLIALDKQGQTLSSVLMSSADVEPAAGGQGFSVLDGKLPAAGVATVQITSGGSVVASRTASARPPKATFSLPRARARVGVGRSVAVRWGSSDPDGDPVKVELDYSADGGRTFRNVYGGGTGTSVVLPADLFQPSTKARLRLRLNDGFNDAETVSPAFVVVPRAPKVTILEPVARQRVAAGSSVYLRGGAIDATGRAVPAGRLRWFAGKTMLGRGNTISAVLPAGTRRIRLVAVAGSGRSGTASVAVTMRATTPFFLRLITPRSLSRKARSLMLTASSTQPAILRIGALRVPLDCRARRIRVKVKPGRATLRLQLRLTAGGKGIVQPVVVPRR